MYPVMRRFAWADDDDVAYGDDEDDEAQEWPMPEDKEEWIVRAYWDMTGTARTEAGGEDI